jgi:hypothetical protein
MWPLKGPHQDESPINLKEALRLHFSQPAMIPTGRAPDCPQKFQTVHREVESDECQLEEVEH